MYAGGESYLASFDIYDSTRDINDLFNIDFDEIAEESLAEAAPVLERSMKKAVQSSIEHTGDSELINSIKASKPKKTRNGAWLICVTPKGYSKVKVYHAKKGRRTYPVSNALKAIWKEYGIAGRQPPKPFLAKAANEASNEVYDIIQKNFDRKAGG